MKYAIVSDIHANLEAFQRVLADARRHVSVSDKDKLRLRCAEVRCGVLFLFDVVELRRVEDVAVRADGAFEVGRIRKRLKPGEFVHGERFAVTLDGISGEIDEGRAVAAARDGVVMVAGEDGRAALADGAERLPC